MKDEIQNRNDFEEFWNLQVKPLWDAYKSGLKKNTETAEKYFVDIAKLIISLSTGLLAFMVVVKNTLVQNTFLSEIKLLVSTFIAAIIFSILAFISLATNYKNYADRDGKSLKNLYKDLKRKRYENIKEKIKQNEDIFLNSADNGWQKLTITFGIISFALFIFGIVYLINVFLSQ